MPELHWQSWDYHGTTSSPSTPTTECPRVLVLHQHSWDYRGICTVGGIPWLVLSGSPRFLQQKNLYISSWTKHLSVHTTSSNPIADVTWCDSEQKSSASLCWSHILADNTRSLWRSIPVMLDSKGQSIYPDHCASCCPNKVILGLYCSISSYVCCWDDLMIRIHLEGC